MFLHCRDIRPNSDLEKTDATPLTLHVCTKGIPQSGEVKSGRNYFYVACTFSSPAHEVSSSYNTSE